MKQNLLKTINLFTLIALLILIGYASFVLFNSYRQGSSKARLEITQLSAMAQTLFTQDQSDLDENLKEFRENLLKVPQIKSFVLYNTANELVYVYARSPRYIEVAKDSNQFLRQSISLKYNSMTETNQKVQLPMDSQLFGEGVYQIFSESSLFSLTTSVFYGLAALTFLLLMSLISSAKTVAATYPMQADESGEQVSSNYESTSPYSPDSGLCFEQQLEERLSNELRRAAAFDEDLAAALIQCNNAAEDRPTYIQLAQMLKKHFNFHDLLFEVNHDKMAVILPNTDLDQGIHELSDFQKEIFEGSDEKICSFDIKIGLSSRNGRLINSDRILKEARAALRKAENDIETNLVGFRPDPGKFRNFLAAQEE